MARVAITEYAAKKLLLGPAYTGISVSTKASNDELSLLENDKTYVVKADTGIKKRGLNGLVEVDVKKEDLASAIQNIFSKGHLRCLVEPYIKHTKGDERYISLSLVRDGIQVLYSPYGGVNIEEHSDTLEKHLVPTSELTKEKMSFLIDDWDISPLLACMTTYPVSFLEINPFIMHNGDLLPLDLAIEIDSAKSGMLPAFLNDHVLSSSPETSEEERIEELNKRSQSSFSYKELNKDGAILTLLSGGGASLVAIDSLINADLEDKILNYSEYSGAPTREETKSYTTTLLTPLFSSKASRNVVLIAGGVSNFTDVEKTFEGILDALDDELPRIQKYNISFIVRRGGVNQDKGLNLLKEYFQKNSIAHEVYGPELSLGIIGERIKRFV